MLHSVYGIHHILSGYCLATKSPSSTFLWVCIHKQVSLQLCTHTFVPFLYMISIMTVMNHCVSVGVV